MKKTSKPAMPAVTTALEKHPLAVSVSVAAAICNLSRPTLYRAIHEGRLRIKRAGVRTLILTADLDRFLKELPDGTLRDVPHPPGRKPRHADMADIDALLG